MAAVRAAITAAGGAAGNAGANLGGTGGAVVGSELIILQYFGSGLNAADVVAAYNQNWIHGTEIRRNLDTNAREVTHDGGNT